MAYRSLSPYGHVAKTSTSRPALICIPTDLRDARGVSTALFAAHIKHADMDRERCESCLRSKESASVLQQNQPSRSGTVAMIRMVFYRDTCLHGLLCLPNYDIQSIVLHACSKYLKHSGSQKFAPLPSTAAHTSGSSAVPSSMSSSSPWAISDKRLVQEQASLHLTTR